MQYVVLGVLDGGLLLLATLGFALVSRVNKFLNIAHAELVSFGGLTAYFLSASMQLNFALAAALAVAATALLGLVIGRFVYDPLLKLKQPPELLLIVSVGVAYFLHGPSDALVVGIKSYPLPQYPDWRLGSLRFPPYQVGILVVALLCVLGLHLFLTKTRSGTHVRAIANNRELAEVRGLDVRSATRNVWLIASALAGLAGVALGMVGTLTSDSGFTELLLILAVAVLAGLGSIYGVVVAALLVGVAMDSSTAWISAGWQDAIAFLIILVALLVRPQGLFGAVRGRTA